MPTIKFFRIAHLSAIICLFFSLPTAADDKTDAAALVSSAQMTFQNFVSDPNMGWFRDNLGDAKALVIVPELYKAGFIFGASGGNGLVLAKDKLTEAWSYPSFYMMSSVTGGLQIGGEVAEVIMLVMTETGMNSLLGTKVQLGGDVSVAVGPVGAGAQAATVDILQFTRTKGIFGGLTLEGAVITPRDDLTRAFYGKPSDPVDVLIRHNVMNKNANNLRELVFQTVSEK